MTLNGSVLCLGEALVDFFAGPGGKHRPEPSFGGSQANVAVGAARFGARSALVGTAGKDRHGRWLHERLAQEEVDVRWFELREDVATPQALVTVSREGEPSFTFTGDDDAWALAAQDSVEDAMEAVEPAVVSFGSDTLIGPRARALTMEARRLALARGALLVYDPNLRERRWPTVEEMLDAGRAPVEGSAVVKANREEAQALTGRDSAEGAARALIALGARAAVVTLGADGALVALDAGEPVQIPGRQARAIDATGAGDAVAAVIAAALAAAGERSLVPATALAMDVAARVCEVRGAVAGLPPPSEARAALDRIRFGR